MDHELLHILVDFGIGALLAAAGWVLKNVLSGVQEVKTGVAVLHETVTNEHHILAQHIQDDKERFASIESKLSRRRSNGRNHA